MKTIAKSFCILSLLASTAAGDAEQAVGKIQGRGGQGSFVCVSPSGYCLTAEHVGVSDTFQVQLGGRQYQASETYDAPKNRIDEAVVFKISGRGPFPYAEVSPEPPKRGDQVWSIGYPRGQRRRWSGRVRSIGGRGAKDTIIVNALLYGGHSGGPLFNAQDQVIGIASASDRRSVSSWIGWGSVQTAMRHVPQANESPFRNPEPNEPFRQPREEPFRQPSPEPQPLPEQRPQPFPNDPEGPHLEPIPEPRGHSREGGHLVPAPGNRWDGLIRGFIPPGWDRGGRHEQPPPQPRRPNPNPQRGPEPRGGYQGQHRYCPPGGG